MIIMRYLRHGMLYWFIWLQMISLLSIVSAADTDTLPSYKGNSIELIPKVTNQQAITQANKDLTSDKSRHKFWETYNTTANSPAFNPRTASGLSNQLSSGIMTWDTIIAYASVIIEFISNLWLVVWAGFIIYSGYQYAMSSFGAKEDNGKAIKNAFVGIAVIASSYGIFRLLARIFIE